MPPSAIGCRIPNRSQTGVWIKGTLPEVSCPVQFNAFVAAGGHLDDTKLCLETMFSLRRLLRMSDSAMTRVSCGCGHNAIVRILIHEIIVDVDDESRTIVLMMHWQGGRHTEVRVPRPSSGRTARCTDADAIALVRRMAGRWHDDAIAAQLHLLGWKTGTGKPW